MGAKATKAAAAHSMTQSGRADAVRPRRRPQSRQGRQDPVPAARALRSDAADRANLSKAYGSLEVFAGVDLAIDRGSRVVVLGFNGAGKTTLLKLLQRYRTSDTGEVVPGHGLKLGYYAQEHETLDPDAHGVGEHPARRAGRRRPGAAKPVGHVPVHR